eukprot:544738-Pelagomonas_calceolata.AAC.6
MEPGAFSNPQDPHWNLIFVASWWRGFKALLSQCVPFSLIDVGRVSSAYVGEAREKLGFQAFPSGYKFYIGSAAS